MKSLSHDIRKYTSVIKKETHEPTTATADTPATPASEAPPVVPVPGEKPPGIDASMSPEQILAFDKYK